MESELIEAGDMVTGGVCSAFLINYELSGVGNEATAKSINDNWSARTLARPACG